MPYAVLTSDGGILSGIEALPFGTADCRLLSLAPHFPPYLSDNYKNSDPAGMKSGYKTVRD